MTTSPTDPPAAVLDTNVLLDWLVFREPAVAALAAAVEAGTVRWLATARTQAEYFDVITRGHLQHWAPDRERSLAAFGRWALMRPEPSASSLHCTDADDQVFIDLAVATRCRWLVTHDRALLKLAGRARAFGVQVLPPSRWAP